MASPRSARQLADLGVAAIDVAGAGGTSWSAVEGELGDDPKTRRLAEPIATGAFRQQRQYISPPDMPDTPVIGSGGVRSGLDANIRALTLSVKLAPLLNAERRRGHYALRHGDEGRSRLFATGSTDLEALKRAPINPAYGGVKRERVSNNGAVRREPII